jgi:hypothetical protein
MPITWQNSLGPAPQAAVKELLRLLDLPLKARQVRRGQAGVQALPERRRRVCGIRREVVVGFREESFDVSQGD